MTRTFRLLMLICLVAMAGTAQAQTVRWNYAEGGYGVLDPDKSSSETGWFLGGAVGLGKVPIHIFGEWGDYDRLEARQLGAGWHGLLGERADLFADAAFYDADVEDGFKIRFGVRWMITERFELNGNLAWLDLDFGDNVSAAANVLFNFTNLFGIGGGYEKGDKLDNGRVFARFTFGGKK